MLSKIINRKHMELQEFQEMKLNVIKKSRFDLHGFKQQSEINLIRDALKQFCQRMQTDIENICLKQNNELSGSTIASVFINGNQLLTLNIGDSKGLMVSVKNHSIVVSQLTKDHKPDMVHERKRIEAKGGVVAKQKDKFGRENGPYRLWDITKRAPGLSISRALGDIYAHTLGLSHEPDVQKSLIEPQDKIIVLGSDGIFEFLSNEDVAHLVYPFYDKYLKRL